LFLSRGILLSIVFVLGTGMMHNLNNKSNNRYVLTTAAIATILTLAIMTTASIMMATAPAAATTTTTTTGTTTSPEEAEMIELSPEPVYRERQITVSQTPINQTHNLLTDSGNGTLTLPNTTEAINVTSIDNVIVSTIDGTAVGEEVFTTVDGSENATAKLFGIARFNMQEGTGKAIVISLLQTNSTGRLASLDGMILAGHVQFQPDGSALATLWEWQSGIPLPAPITTTPPLEPPLMDTTTLTDNAATTTAADNTNATAPTPEEEEGEEEQQRQQTTPTIPPAPNPLFE
jgi:hypothetical protein